MILENYKKDLLKWKDDRPSFYTIPNVHEDRLWRAAAATYEFLCLMDTTYGLPLMHGLPKDFGNMFYKQVEVIAKELLPIEVDIFPPDAVYTITNLLGRYINSGDMTLQPLVEIMASHVLLYIEAGYVIGKNYNVISVNVAKVCKRQVIH